MEKFARELNKLLYFSERLIRCIGSVKHSFCAFYYITSKTKIKRSYSFYQVSPTLHENLQIFTLFFNKSKNLIMLSKCKITQLKNDLTYIKKMQF